MSSIVDRLVRQRHKIARPHARLRWDKQTTGSRLKYRDADDIANPEFDFRGRPMVAKRRRKRTRAPPLQDLNDLRREHDKAIGGPVPSRARPDDHRVWPRGRYQ